MKKYLTTILGITALLFALTINFGYAINNYGILENTLSFHVTAQASTSNGGNSESGNSNGSSSGDGTSTGNIPLIRKEVREDCTAQVWAYKESTGKYGYVELAGKRDSCIGSWSYSCKRVPCSPAE